MFKDEVADVLKVKNTLFNETHGWHHLSPYIVESLLINPLSINSPFVLMKIFGPKSGPGQILEPSLLIIHFN